MLFYKYKIILGNFYETISHFTSELFEVSGSSALESVPWSEQAEEEWAQHKNIQTCRVTFSYL